MIPIYHPEAELEATNAAEYFRARSPALARNFRDALEVCLLSILEFPESHPVMFERTGARRANLQRFPYQVVYLIDPDVIYIVAIAHERREPLYWLRRIEP